MRPIEPWILGLDIGTDSLGWAVFSCEEKGPPTAKELLGGGVRLFDSGRDAKDHTSRQAERGAFRRARRQTRTWPWRRDRLIALFQAAGLTPPAAETRQIALALRREAVSRPLAPDALWAALLHLAHHRGFRSNRIDKRERAAAKALAKAKPAKATAKATAPAKEADDEAGFWEGAEAALRQRMAASGAPTVGALLADDLDRGQPVRMRYNQSDRDGVVAPTRALIAEELAEIVARQSSAYPGLDWPAVTRLVLDQRPLRSKGAGPCAFLPGEDRALRALPTVQDFIIRQTLANLRLPSTSADEPRPLTDEEHAKALALLSTARFVEWPALRRALGLKRGVKFTAETERNGAKQAARGTAGNLTEAILAPLIPGWSGWDLDRKDRVFSDLWAARQDRSALLALIGDPRGPTRVTEDETAEAVADAIQIVLPTGRASLSAKAARAIAQAMAPGIGYDEAVTLALGLHHSHRPRQERLARLPYYAAALPDVGLDGDPVGPPPAEDDGAAAEAYYGRIGNISVHIALNETRKIVNALLHRHGPILRLVMVETTRELKAGADERKRMIAEQAERERENAEIDVELRKSDRWMANARERRQRVRLARRQNNLCPYTSTPIGHADLLGDAYDIDHVIPLARGGRDSLDNMVLCQSDANKTKGDKTPWEAFHDKPGWIAQRDDFLARLDPQTAKALAWRFADDAGERVARKSAEDEDQGFLPRQLTDTGYIARVALRYLSLVTNEPNAVVATNGRLTGLLRLAWDITPGPAPRDLLPTPRDALRDDTAARRFLDGLTPPPLAKAVEGAVQARLAALGRSRVADAGLADALGLTLASLGGGGKNRADHRHHFIDAAMIAVTTRGLINQINQASGAGRILDLRKWPRTNFEPPYPTFRAEVMKQWDHIHPSIRPAHRDGGSLHAATVFGVRNRPDARVLVQRKPVEKLFLDANAKPLPADKIAEIIDGFASPRMAKRFKALLARYQAAHPEVPPALAALAVARDPAFGPRGMTANTVIAGRSDGDGEDAGLITPFRANPKAAVRTMGNAVYEVWEIQVKGRPRWTHRVLTRFDRTQPAPPPPPENARLVMRLRRGDLVYWPLESGDRLFLVKKMAVDGRLALWPARLATGKATALYAQLSCPNINLNGDQGYCVQSAEGIRKEKIRTTSCTALGRLRLSKKAT